MLSEHNICLYLFLVQTMFYFFQVNLYLMTFTWQLATILHFDKLVMNL